MKRLLFQIILCFAIGGTVFGQASTDTPTKTATPTRTPTPRANFVSFRDAGCVAVGGTAIEIGTHPFRDEIMFRNVSGDNVFCGNNSTTLSSDPGPFSGMPYGPGEGAAVCVYADVALYCISAGASTVCWNEARIVTPTPVP